MSAEFPKAEVAPAETKEEKMARLRAELAELEAPEEPVQALEAQAEVPAGTTQESATETVAVPDPSVAERAAVDEAALAATRERLGMQPVTSESSELSGEIFPQGEFEMLATIATGRAPEDIAERRILEEGERKPSQNDYEGTEVFRNRVRAETMKLISETTEKVRALPAEEQARLGGAIFDETIGKGGPGWSGAVDTLQFVHRAFAGTPFGEAFDKKHQEFLVALNAR